MKYEYVRLDTAVNDFSATKQKLIVKLLMNMLLRDIAM